MMIKSKRQYSGFIKMYFVLGEIGFNRVGLGGLSCGIPEQFGKQTFQFVAISCIFILAKDFL
jgi:hypothetical protein